MRESKTSVPSAIIVIDNSAPKIGAIIHGSPTRTPRVNKKGQPGGYIPHQCPSFDSEPKTLNTSKKLALGGKGNVIFPIANIRASNRAPTPSSIRGMPLNTSFATSRYEVKETKNINAVKARGGRFIIADHARLIIDDSGENPIVMPMVIAISVKTGSESVAV